jgi:hypothetical protein
MSRRKSSPVTPALPPAPKPAPTAESLAMSADINARLVELNRIVTDNNLLRVRALVEMALRRQVPAELVDHFSIIGRDYYKLADYGPAKPNLRVVDGSKA